MKSPSVLVTEMKEYSIVVARRVIFIMFLSAFSRKEIKAVFKDSDCNIKVQGAEIIGIDFLKNK